MKKNKNKQKPVKAQKVQKVVVTKKVANDEAIRIIDDKVNRFNKAVDTKLSEVVAKHNELATQIAELQKVQQQIATFAATEFGKILAQQQTFTTSFGQSIDHLDINLLALVEVTKEVFGQLAQIDHILQHAEIVPASEGSPISKLNVDVVTDADVEVVKQKATDWQTSVTQAAFRTVLEQRQAEEVAHSQAALEAQKQAERAATDQSEAERVEKELRDAESANLVAQVSGGRGADIPEGADVFGG